MREHFSEVEKGDVVLVINETKHNLANYIGGNVLLEMGLGFYLHKPLLVFNDLPEESSYKENLIALGAIPLRGDFKALLLELEHIKTVS